MGCHAGSSRLNPQDGQRRPILCFLIQCALRHRFEQNLRFGRDGMKESPHPTQTLRSRVFVFCFPACRNEYPRFLDGSKQLVALDAVAHLAGGHEVLVWI